MNRRVLAIGGVVVLLGLVAAGAYLYWPQKPDEASSQTDSSSESQQTDQPAASDADGSDAGEQQTGVSVTSEKGVIVTIEEPALGAKVSSPLTVSGSVPGFWTHEGQFTVRLLGPNGDVLASQSVAVDGDWMTEELLPFTASLAYDASVSGRGSVELVRANPSDLPENADSVFIPVDL